MTTHIIHPRLSLLSLSQSTSPQIQPPQSIYHVYHVNFPELNFLSQLLSCTCAQLSLMAPFRSLLTPFPIIHSSSSPYIYTYHYQYHSPHALDALLLASHAVTTQLLEWHSTSSFSTPHTRPHRTPHYSPSSLSTLLTNPSSLDPP